MRESAKENSKVITDLRYFGEEHVPVIAEALRIAEELVSERYKLSTREWLSHPYEVLTLKADYHMDRQSNAFAVLKKARPWDAAYSLCRHLKELYLICLQDHLILKAMGRDDRLELFPLMLYIFTHELVHIVRFAKFFQRFDVDHDKREHEENIVYNITADVLSKFSFKGIDYILSCYQESKYHITSYKGGA